MVDCCTGRKCHLSLIGTCCGNSWIACQPYTDCAELRRYIGSSAKAAVNNANAAQLDPESLLFQLMQAVPKQLLHQLQTTRHNTTGAVNRTEQNSLHSSSQLMVSFVSIVAFLMMARWYWDMLHMSDAHCSVDAINPKLLRAESRQTDAEQLEVGRTYNNEHQTYDQKQTRPVVSNLRWIEQIQMTSSRHW